MNTDLQSAQVNALKIADTLSTELATRADLKLFFAQTMGERKSNLQLNRYEYLLNKIYPIVYQHMIADTQLYEDTLFESAKIVAAQINGVVLRASEAAAQELVKTPQWEELYNSISPIQGLKKTPWDLNNSDLVDDAVYFVAQLVHVNGYSSICPDNANKWLDHFSQKSFGLINTNSTNSQAYAKSKGFATKVIKSGWLEHFPAVYEKHLFAQIAQQLEASRDLVVRHTQTSSTIVKVQEQEDTSQNNNQAPAFSAKMNHR